MEPTDLRNKNSFGYAVNPSFGKETEADFVFKSDADQVVDLMFAGGSCLIEGGVGVGKSHLVNDVGGIARSSELDMPTLVLSAHKNTGAKRGVKHALDILTKFEDEVGDEGLIIIDNIDMYAYSGSSAKRQYSLAQKHTEVAKHILDVVNNPDAPFVCATSHDKAWRDSHWRYSHKRKPENDEVTPVASALLGAFSVKHSFTGLLNEEVAERMLVRDRKFRPVQAERIISEMSLMTTGIAYRVVSKLDPARVFENGLRQEIKNIQQVAEQLTRGKNAPPLGNTVGVARGAKLL